MSLATMLKGKEWWIDKRGRKSNRRIYPERIVVGDPFNGRVYVPERTCRMEGPDPIRGRCTNCGAFIRRDAVADCTSVIPVSYCANCGSLVAAESLSEAMTPVSRTANRREGCIDADA